MKLTCLQENLAEGLSRVSHAVATKGSLPILSHILLQTESGKLKLSATNLETGVITWVGAKIEKEGSLTVPARLFLDLVNSLGSGQLELLSENQILTVQSTGNRSRLNGVSSEEFPILPKPSAEPALLISPELFSKAISQVVFAAASDESRPILTGILFKASEDNLTLVGVDGFRLSERKIKLDKPVEKEIKLVIPSRTLSEVGRLVSSENDPIAIYLPEGENQLIFKSVYTEVSSRILEGDFPDYEKIIPKNFTTEVEVEASELVKAVRLASIFAKDSSNIIKFKLNPDEEKVTLSANAADIGDNENDLKVAIEGLPTEIAFNAKYLLDCLGNIKSEKLLFKCGSSLSPGLFQIKDEDTFLHLIMPVRVQA